MTATDLDLLRQFARDHSQDAFTTLVKRHVNLVYSAALRQIRSPQLAEEIAQSVFADLARNAEKLKPDTVLTAWLYAVARRTAIDVIRKESRRQLREQIAVEMNAMNAAAANWNEIEPLLDDALAALDETDRTAILLRYFENKNLREVGTSLSLSDDAAQKRVSRAVERLREFFSKRNVTIGASGLTVLISANAVQSAPIGLAATISAGVFAGTAVSVATVIAATKTIAMTTFQKTLITAALVVTAGAGIFEAHQATQLHEQNRQQQTSFADQLRQLQQALDDATNRLANVIAENEELQSNSNRLELLKLRGQVAQMREINAKTSEDDANESLVKSWLARETQLKQLAQQYPDKSIPEFQLLSEQQWLDAAMNAKFDTDKNIQQDLADLRRAAGNNFASIAQSALSKYMKANNGQFPTDLSQLQPYFSSPVDDAILQRWEIAPASTVPNVGVGNPIITEKSLVDTSLDMINVIGPNGSSGTSYQAPEISAAIATVKPAMQAYAAANNGSQPTDPSQILPYLTTPQQQAAYQTLMKKYPANNPAQ